MAAVPLFWYAPVLTKVKTTADPTMTTQQLLARPVLILNRYQRAIDTTTVEEAICAVVRGHKRALHLPTGMLCTWDVWTTMEIAEGDLCIRGTRGPVLVPSVIVTTYAGMPEKMPKRNRRGIGKRDNFTCVYTNVYCPDTGTLDHVIPKDQGGTSTWENLGWCSPEINQRKANRTPEQAGLRLLRRPFRPKPRPAIQLIEPVLPEWEPFVSSRRMETAR